MHGTRNALCFCCPREVKGSSAHANPGHMYTQRPFSGLTVTCARKTTVTCTHQRSHGHMYTQVRSSAHAKRRSHVHTSDATVTCTHHYSGYGVGWSDNVHVSVHAQARQPYHLSGCSADTSTTHPCVPLNYCLHFTSLFKLPLPCVPLNHCLHSTSLFKLPPPAFH